MFGLYGLTMGDLAGYETETAGVSEGLVQKGQPRIVEGTPLTPQGVPGRGGHLYSRTGLTQPVLEAPFYWVGKLIDDNAAQKGRYVWRVAALRLFNPAMAALTVVAVFALLLLRGVRQRRALVVAGFAALASLIWPYSKVGLDTTLMAMIALAVLAAAWAAADPGPGRLALTGTAVALAANSKPYGLIVLLGLAPLLAHPIARLPRSRRWRALVALGLPVLAGIAVMGWYNWYRTGSVTDFANQYYPEILATPINALGLFFSPGKGLLFYSPLVILGLIALPAAWRADRPLAQAIVVMVAVNTVVIAASSQWSDETWGPRYIVPTAWLLVIPLAWWRRERRRVLIAAAAVAACIQFVGVFSSYATSVTSARALSGDPVFPHTPPPGDAAGVAYGDDGPRWIPEASPLLFQTELLAAWGAEQLTGTGFTVSYNPFEGHVGSIDLRHPEPEFGQLPDFWWTFPSATGSAKQELLAVFLALIAAGATAGIVLRARSV